MLLHGESKDWSDWADVQADLSLRRTGDFVVFCSLTTLFCLVHSAIFILTGPVHVAFNGACSIAFHRFYFIFP